MAFTTTGSSYTTGDQVTAATQNAQVNAATAAAGSVDDSTTQLSSGAIIVKDGGITPSKCSAGHPVWTSAGALSQDNSSNSIYTATLTNGGGDGKGLNIIAGSAGNSAAIGILYEDSAGTDVFKVQGDGTTTASGTITAPTTNTTRASFNAPHGTAPTSPVDGDIWTTSAGLFVRINGVTKTVTLT